MLLTAIWGTLWGVAFGLCVLAPEVLATHRVRPESVGQWMVVVAGFCGVFAVLGAGLAVFAGFALVCLERLVAGEFRDRTWAYALSSGPLLVAAYALNSIFVHWMNFRSLSFWQDNRGQVALIIAAWLCAIGAVLRLYRWIGRREKRPAPAILGCGLATVAVSGVLVLVLRTPPPLTDSAVPDSLTRVSSRAEDPPLLFIGLDGAAWRVLQSAIDDGSAPTLRGVMAQGIHGTVEAAWPPYWSGAAWASILTGLPRDVTGVYEDLAGAGPGLPAFQVPLATSLLLNPFYTVRAALRQGGVIDFTPPPRTLLHGKPVWQLLYEAGVNTAVVRFRFTYPPDGQANVVVSDWVGEDQWEDLGVRRQALPDRVAPAHRATELLAPFLPTAPYTSDPFSELLPVLPDAPPSDTLRDPIRELRLASEIDRRTFEATEIILRESPVQPFLAVYIGGLDSVEHAFWQYRFPNDFSVNRPGPDDIEHLGPVIDRYVRYVDQSLARLLSLYTTRPNVLIVSDHGHGAATFESGWRGWHTKEGVFLLAGPSVPHMIDGVQVSYYDVLPTILDLKGFERPKAVTGTSVLRRVPSGPGGQSPSATRTQPR